MNQKNPTAMANKLTAKLIIKGHIEACTGLHIGGSKSSLDIGEVDLNVIKSPKGKPFIPGSSLKGKMRSLLARVHGTAEVKDDELYIKEIFGASGDERETGEINDQQFMVTRLIVRDAELNESAFQAEFNEDAREKLDFDFTDVKFENTINRIKGVAEHPRQLERVPAGAKFDFELVYDVYSDADEKIEEKDRENRLATHLDAIQHAMQLLQDDYLGGQGSRGYGKIRFAQNITVSYKPVGSAGEYVAAKSLNEPFATFQTKLQSLHQQALS